MSLSELPSLTELALEAPPALRGIVAACGVLVLLFGARLYRPGLLLAAFAAGAMGALGALQSLAAVIPEAGEPPTLLVGAVSAGAVGAVVAHLAHKLALVVVGCLAGLTGTVAVVALLTLPWWVVPIGAVLGAVALPRVYPQLLRVLTPAVGAGLVAWALTRPEDPWLLGGLWLVGVVFQLRSGASRPDREEEG